MQNQADDEQNLGSQRADRPEHLGDLDTVLAVREPQLRDIANQIDDAEQGPGAKQPDRRIHNTQGKAQQCFIDIQQK